MATIHWRKLNGYTVLWLVFATGVENKKEIFSTSDGHIPQYKILEKGRVSLQKDLEEGSLHGAAVTGNVGLPTGTAYSEGATDEFYGMFATSRVQVAGTEAEKCS